MSASMSTARSARKTANPKMTKCSLCGGKMELIASRAGREKTMRTFRCHRCGNTDTVAVEGGESRRTDAA